MRQCDFAVRGSLDDFAVVLDGDRLRVHAELVEVSKERHRALELDALAVDLQRDHSKSLIAA